MFMNPAPDRYLDLFDTPEGRARSDILYAQYRAVIYNAKALPSEISAAAARFRQERSIDAGKEGLTGPASCYHLEEIAFKLQGPASLMFRGDPWHECTRPKQRPRVMLQILAKYHGYRYLIGVRGLTDALKEARVSPVQRGRFMLERDEFNSRFIPMTDAAFMVNEHGDNPNAATACMKMLIEEMLSLADWLELTAEANSTLLIRPDIRLVQDMIQSYEDEASEGTGVRRRVNPRKR